VNKDLAGGVLLLVVGLTACGTGGGATSPVTVASAGEPVRTGTTDEADGTTIETTTGGPPDVNTPSDTVEPSVTSNEGVTSETPMAGVESLRVLDAACNEALVSSSIGRVATPELDEISGVVASRQYDDVLWVHNDSGGAAQVTALSHDGTPLGAVDVAGTAVDWEDIAIGPGPDGTDWLYVADIGDNLTIRSTVTIYRFPEPPPRDGLVTPEVIEATYEDGSMNAEALVVDPEGVMWIIGKVDPSPAPIYRYDESAAVFRRAGEFDPGPAPGFLVTGADLSVDGTVLAVRTYVDVQLFELGDRSLEALGDVERCSVLVFEELPPNGQGEAVALTPDGAAFLTISEGASPSIYRYSPP
jgi:hypothetical protein